MANLFANPISTTAPLGLFPRRPTHPVNRNAIVNFNGRPVPTNRWYANLFLGNQTNGVWPLPYMLSLNKDAASWGLSISHTEENQLAFGPNAAADPVQYYISPLGIRSIQMGALELNGGSQATVENPTSFTAQLNLNIAAGNTSRRITFPLSQGMGFITGQYNNLTPVFDSVVLFRTLTPMNGPRGGVQKWEVILEDGRKWMIYACPQAGTPNLELTRVSNRRIQGNYSFTGFIQVAKVSPGQEGVLDQTAGAFVTGVNLSGSVSGETATYRFDFVRFGQNNANGALVYALPHQVASFATETAGRRTASVLRSTTKGMMTAVISDSWIMNEQAPNNYGWLAGNAANLSANTASFIRGVAEQELQQDMIAQSNLDSMYFSGKALAKFAQILMVVTDTIKDFNMARPALTRLQQAMGNFTANNQKFKLVYDDQWKGISSDASYVTGDPGVDFGNSYYNDHHFHYGYFIYTAAVIVYVERKINGNTNWLNANREWVNTLVRDTANPVTNDPYFPQNRAFDFFCGHSWAKGLFESADGKDQESSSEDVNFAYAIKLWGNAIGDAAMEGRGNLMLGVMKRSMNAYFLLSNGNANHPARFIKNKVTGILFENKVDHTTYFGADPRLIQGIHMLPLIPVSSFVRSSAFVAEEWNAYFSNGRANSASDGWKGVLYANLALTDPGSSWRFFAGQTEGWNNQWLDGGASRTWYLAFAAGLGGVA